MSKKHLYVRPKNPASPEAEGQALEVLVTWAMGCTADFDRREADKKRKGDERGSPPPSSSTPIAAKSTA